MKKTEEYQNDEKENDNEQVFVFVHTTICI